jgi:hypothetical protein
VLNGTLNDGFVSATDDYQTSQMGKIAKKAFSEVV